MAGRSLGGDQRHRPGRPRWTDQLRNDTGSVAANLWRQTGHSTGPWWGDAMAQAGYAMKTMMTTMGFEAAVFTSWMPLLTPN